MGSNWIFRPRELLDANSPSRLDGVSAEREEAKRLAYTGLLQDCGEAMRIPIPTVATAAVFCHHFYATRSMRTNDTWVVATASLFLACKACEGPKALKDVILHMWTMRHRGQVAQLECIQDREWQDMVKAAVLKAERALLYVIAFDFKVTHPYQSVLIYIKHFGLGKDNEAMMQTAWDMITLSLRTTLSLQLKHESIAAAAIVLAMKLHRMETPLVDGRPWYLLPPVNATPALMEVAMTQLLEVAEKLKRLQVKRAAPRELVALLQQQRTAADAAQQNADTSSAAAAGDSAAAGGPLRPLGADGGPGAAAVAAAAAAAAYDGGGDGDAVAMQIEEPPGPPLAPVSLLEDQGR